MAHSSQTRDTATMLHAIKRLGVWGDSILKGIVQDASTKKYAMPKVSGLSIAAEKLGIRLINHSHFGFTIERGKQTLLHDLSNGVACEAGILEYGGNDCNYPWSEVANAPNAIHEPNTPTEVFLSELKHLVTLLRTHGIEPILMSLPPLVPERFFRHIIEPGLSAGAIRYWLRDINRLYRWQESYSDAIVRLTKRERCALLDVRSAFLRQGAYQSFMCCDGIHPNELGQSLIGQVFSNLVRQSVARRPA